jgi:hypothetical protein
MKSLPFALEKEIQKEAYTSAYLFTFELPNHTYYWTNFEKDIFYQSKWWTSKGIRFNKIDSSMATRADSVEFEIDNVDKKISDLHAESGTEGSPRHHRLRCPR